MAAPPLPAVGSIWTYGQLDRAIAEHAKHSANPFRFELQGLDLSDEEAQVPETMILRCTEPARPLCAWRIVVGRVPGDKTTLWRVDSVTENHTHWQSVFADPAIRQEAIELAERHAHETPPSPAADKPPKTPTSPLFDLPNLPSGPSKPLLWSPSKPSASEEKPARPPLERKHSARFLLTHRILPHVPSIEDWQASLVSARPSRKSTPPPLQGSSKDHESRPSDVFGTPKARPAPLLLAPVSPTKLISPSFDASQFANGAPLSPSHPFSARLPSPGGRDKGKARAMPDEDEDAMQVDAAESPRTTLLNAVARIGPTANPPDTPLVVVRPGCEVDIETRAPSEDPNVDVPPIPAIKSRWPSREAFKDACQAHAGAIKPPFGFTTPTSSVSGPMRFIIYACRHNRKGGGGCPYMLRCQAINAADPNSEWEVTDGYYRHANHQIPSPPLRLGWGLSKPIAAPIPEKRTADDALTHLALNAQPAVKRIRAASPPVDRRMPLDVYLSSLHPALSSPVCVVALKAVGIDGTETIASLTTHELAVLLASCDRSLTALQRSVLANRLARHLDDDPRVGNRPGRKPRTIAGALAACHPTMFPREGDGGIVARLLEEAGVPDSETLKSLEPEELVEIVLAIPQLSECQRVVLTNRVGML